MSRDIYENPLIKRYASKEMGRVFSDEMKFTTWRKLWIALAEAEREMGLPITDEQICELREHAEDINYEQAEAREKIVRHDVMSHVYAYGLQCPAAKPIIHLGATSCYVGDNADVIIMHSALDLIERKLLNVMNALAGFAREYRAMPTLGFTHYQPAQLTTVGKRACLWLQELLMDYEELLDVRRAMKLRGVKGTTGTQASFCTLFDGDAEKIAELERRVVAKMGFSGAFAVTGQTYPRKLDSRAVNLLANIAQSAYKFSGDLRLLQNLKEMEEPFESAQIGSSAMAYKRNPMRSERIASLSRYVMSLASSPMATAAVQWFERTLDDSANKRLVIPQAFLAVDAVLGIYLNIASGMVVYPKVIAKHISDELPFMATETIMMEAVKAGGDRQDLHERIRELSMKASYRVKAEGLPNNLVELMKADSAFAAVDIDALLAPENFIGLADVQTDRFLAEHIDPLLKEHAGELGLRGEVNV